MVPNLEEDIWQRAMAAVQTGRKKIGIGIRNVTPRIVDSLRRASQYVDVMVVGQHVRGFECVESNTIEPLVQIAKDRKVDGIVRGNFDALDGYRAVKTVLGHKGSIFELNAFKINGIKSIDEYASGTFCLLPVSFANERTVEDKIRSIELHLQFFKKIGVTPRIGLLGPGKPSDKQENVPEVDAGLQETAYLIEFYTERGIWVKYFNHQIEYAAQEANIIVAQNSWAGNLAAHCLVYLGSCDYLGGTALNIREIVYIDNGEAMQDFTNCLIFGGYLAGFAQG